MLKGKTWEDIYGVEGAQKRRKSVSLAFSKARKGVPPTNKLKREIRYCLCKCGFSKEVRVNSDWKFKAGHNSKMASFRNISGLDLGRTSEARKVAQLGIKKWHKQNKNTTEYLTRSSKISFSLGLLWDNPEFIKTRLQVISKGYKQGVFYSYKNNCNIRFQSSYELYAYLKLEHMDNVISYGRCHFSIHYTYRGMSHKYIPDILVDFLDGTQAIIEIKPGSFLTKEKVYLKSLAGEKYCRINGLKYITWTEKDLEDKNERV